MATSAPTTGAPTRAPLPDIRELSINGITPFLSGPDIRDDAIRGAHAILTMLSSGFENADDMYRRLTQPGDEDPVIEGCNSRIKADALHGIGTLLALAQYGTDLSYAEREARKVAA